MLYRLLEQTYLHLLKVDKRVSLNVKLEWYIIYYTIHYHTFKFQEVACSRHPELSYSHALKAGRKGIINGKFEWQLNLRLISFEFELKRRPLNGEFEWQLWKQISFELVGVSHSKQCFEPYLINVSEHLRGGIGRTAVTNNLSDMSLYWRCFFSKYYSTIVTTDQPTTFHNNG